MKKFAFLRSARASRADDVHGSLTGPKSWIQGRLVSRVGLYMLLLIPAAVLLTSDFASAGGACCRGRGYRTVAYSRGYVGGLGPGSSGPAVASVQRRLNAVGFPVGVDGLYGYQTTSAVRAFQASNGLAPDGIVGPATAQALRYDSNVAYVPPVAPCNRPSCGVAAPIYPPAPVAGPVVREPNRYVVAVPSNDPETLARVRRFSPGAFFTESRLGTYINAGTFDDNDPAENQAEVLRAYGLDAQVRFLDF